MKKSLWGMLILVIAFIFGWGEWQKRRAVSRVSIGIIQAIEHPALDETRRGIEKTLKEKGWIHGENIQLKYESAQGNPALATQIARQMVGNDVKILITIGTTPSQAALQAIQQAQKNIPVVFASVTDPIGSKLIQNPQKPEANITGVSNYVDPGKMFDVFSRILPDIKTIGVVFNPGEANSVILVERMRQAALDRGTEIILASASRTSEVLSATQSLVGKVDVIFINNDNTALSSFEAVARVGRENRIPIFVSDLDCLNKGAFVACGPNQYKIGVQAGEMVLKILSNHTKISEIPVEYPKFIETKFNVAVAEALKIVFQNEWVGSVELFGN